MKPCLALFLTSLLVLLSGCAAMGCTDPVSDSAVLVLEGSGTVVYADDTESVLTAEQERLLLSFFKSWYQSLAQRRISRSSSVTPIRRTTPPLRWNCSWASGRPSRWITP